MKSSIYAVLGAAALLSLSGCATIVSGTSQTVSVQAINDQSHALIPNAKCTLTNSKGVVFPIS